MSDAGTPALMAEALLARPAPSAPNFSHSVCSLRRILKEDIVSRRFQYIGSSRPSRSRTSTRKFSISKPATESPQPENVSPDSGSHVDDDASDV